MKNQYRGPEGPRDSFLDPVIRKYENVNIYFRGGGGGGREAFVEISALKAFFYGSPMHSFPGTQVSVVYSFSVTSEAMPAMQGQYR